MPGIYYSKSKGATPIDGMNHRHAANSLKVLLRDEPSRVEEIQNLRDRLAVLAAEYRVALLEEQASGEASPERLAEIEAELTRLDAEAIA